jgi:uncharacterized protein
MYEKPLPAIDIESAPFWQAAREHRLAIMQCRLCDRHFFYPRALCPHCHSSLVEWTKASGRGAIYSFTIAGGPATTAPPPTSPLLLPLPSAAFKPDVPYVVALVELEEGPRLMTNIVTTDVDGVRIGQKVTAVYDDVTDEVTLVKFAPV